MIARHKLNIPLIIGSCGTCGTDNMVDWMEDITLELSKELNQNLKIAKIYSELSKEKLLENYKNGSIANLKPKIKINEKIINNISHTVALAGIEQIQAAINTKADIILAGRTTDTAIIAALPILKGSNPGISWHGAKVAECGALCSTEPTSGVVMVEFYHSHFNLSSIRKSKMYT